MASPMDALTQISDITSARSKEDLLLRMRRAAAAMGYDHVLFAIEMRLPAMEPVQDINSGYPAAYTQLYWDRAFVGRDPTVAHCQVSTEPLVWSEKMYENIPGGFEVFEESHRFHLGEGVSLPVHQGRRIVSMMSLARDKPFESEAEKTLVLAAGNVLANCVHVASENLILPDVLAERRPRLSPRERQCLQLIAMGKSNWDIGELLNLSEATVAFHVKNMMRKLNVSTRMQAVAIGVNFGLVE